MSQPRPRKNPWQYARFGLFAGAVAALAAFSGPGQNPVQTAAVIPGVEVWLTTDPGDLAGKRIGLITNHTGITRAGVSTIDVLRNDSRVKLVSLFGVEHGIRGDADAGDRVDAAVDQKSGLPVHTLYNVAGNYRPTITQMREIDALMFDIQDIGARYYTYVWNMIIAMEFAAEMRKPFVILDRPNPIGGELVQGRLRDRRDHVGLYPVPMRHGLTAGELARWVNGHFKIGADLRVIPMKGWSRGMWFNQTGLPWIKPSTNMHDLEAATHYPGTCLFEGTNLSVGRGTGAAFSIVGAPWLNAEAVVGALRARNLPGVRFEVTRFTPRAAGDNKYNDQLNNGIRFIVTDRKTYDPTKAGIHALVEIQRLHADSLRFNVAHFDRLAGSKTVREQVLAGATAQRITADWDAISAAFKRERAPYLLYK